MNFISRRTEWFKMRKLALLVSCETESSWTSFLIRASNLCLSFLYFLFLPFPFFSGEPIFIKELSTLFCRGIFALYLRLQVSAQTRLNWVLLQLLMLPFYFYLRSFILQRLDSRPNYVIINNILQVQGPRFFSQSPWYINLIVIPPFSRIQIIIHLCLCDESASSQIVEQVIRVVEYNANNSQGQTYG